jgi:hypothetical protein
VTFRGGLNVAPSWSPDGEHLVYTARDRDDRGTIWSVPVVGGSPTNLSRSSSVYDGSWTGAWGPDGRIVFTRYLQPIPEDTPIVRLDLATAIVLLSTAIVAAVVVLLASTAPPPGTFTLVLTLALALLAAPTEQWRFVPAGLAAGLATDLAVWLGPRRLARRLAGSAATATLVLATALIALATTGLAWTPTLVLGVATAAAAIGWGIGALAEASDPPGVAAA